MRKDSTLVLLLCFLLAGCEESRQDVTVYTTRFEEGLSGVATGDFYDPAVSYAPIAVDGKYKHVLSFQMTPMLPPWRGSVPSNGPLILFSDELDVLVFSPMDHFFISLIWFEDGKIQYGIQGEMDQAPAGMEHRFILVRGKGIGATIERWGELLRQDRGRERVDRYADLGLSHLGYWTDNGAYYYYNTEPGMNEEDTLLAVKADADARGIPYGYMQLDSWWYFKEPGALGPSGGLVRWEPQPEMFPEGLAAFRQKLDLPLITHNRWFAIENDYRADHTFIEDEVMALPLGRGVFDEFMQNAVSWGVFTYEQDWLINQYWGISYLREAAGNAEAWMGDMHDAAADHGLTMQLCMAGPGHLLDALDRPAVTTIRTSIDYSAGVSKESFWPFFHQVNLLAWAVGILPFKDNFHASEDRGAAEALISILSAGMVGVGDRLGEADPVLLARTCRQDGLLLKPDRPAFPIDAMFLDHRRPYTVSTNSSREGRGVWTYLAAFNLASEHDERTAEDEVFAAIAYDGKPLEDMFVWPRMVTEWRVDLKKDLGISRPVVAYDWRREQATEVEGSLDLPPIGHIYDFTYFVLAPVFDNGVALIGEKDKFITLAYRRFVSIDEESDSLAVRVAGVEGEEITLLAYDAEAGHLLDPVPVTVGAGGEADAVISR
jgi:hypothetical protein